MEVIIGILGLIVGFVFGSLYILLRQGVSKGCILMHREDPGEPPYLVVELYDQPETLYGHKQVLFDISQK